MHKIILLLLLITLPAPAQRYMIYTSNLARVGVQTGQSIVWNGSNWIYSLAGLGTATSFASATSVTVIHNYGTSGVLVKCFVGGTPTYIRPSLVHHDLNQVVITFASAQTGVCLVK